MDLISILFILILLCISSFFSACETAITSASKARFHQLAKEGNKNAAIIRHFQDNLGYAISVFVSCNIALNSFGVALAATLLIKYFGERAAEMAAAIMTVLIVVYAEVMPKMLAILYSETILLKSARLLQIIFNLFRPLNIAIHWIARHSVGAFGIRTTPTQADYEASVEELRGAIDLHTGSNQDVVHEKAMLKSILDLGSVAVGEIMKHRQNVMMLDANLPLEQLVDEILKSPFTRIPLWKATPDNIVGVLNVKTLLRELRQFSQSHATTPGGLPADFDIIAIAMKPWFVPESTDLLDQLMAFRSRHEHFSIVVDEYGAILGIVTLEDLLEEIVGDISDEHDVEAKGIHPQPDGTYIVEGTVTLRDVNRELNWDLPDEDAATIAGFILYEARIIPTVGQVFSFHGYRFEILKRQRQQITQIKIVKEAIADAREEGHT